jgi:hypothetical protein
LFQGLAFESGREAVDILAIEVEAARVATWRQPALYGWRKVDIAAEPVR